MNTDKPDAVELTRIGRAHFDANGNYLNSVQVMRIEFENQIRELTAERDELLREVGAARRVINETIEELFPKVWGDTARGQGIGGQIITSEPLDEYASRMERLQSRLEAFAALEGDSK